MKCCITSRSLKVKSKIKTVNQEVVERKICVLPRKNCPAHESVCNIIKLTVGSQMRL